MKSDASYSEKLKDPRWQKKRLKILERDDWSCQLCKSKTETLHVHHRRYLPDTEPWDHPDELLLTLCDICHELESGDLPHALNEARLALQDTWLSHDIYLFAASLQSAVNNPAVDSTLLNCLITVVMDDPQVRMAALEAYMKRFAPIEPFLSRIHTQIATDATTITNTAKPNPEEALDSD